MIIIIIIIIICTIGHAAAATRTVNTTIFFLFDRRTLLCTKNCFKLKLFYSLGERRNKKIINDDNNLNYKRWKVESFNRKVFCLFN